jgi:hypothetical protein
MQIACRAWLAERGTMQRLERPSEARLPTGLGSISVGDSGKRLRLCPATARL